MTGFWEFLIIPSVRKKHWKKSLVFVRIKPGGVTISLKNIAVQCIFSKTYSKVNVFFFFQKAPGIICVDYKLK